MPITALPALNRTSGTFKTDVDTFLGAQLPAFVGEANALQTDVNAKQSTASAAATTATTQASNAAASASTASTQATTATTQASNASTSASTATTKAGEAGTSASTATTKAGEASTSASAAASSAASIAGGPVASIRGMTGVVVSDTSGGIPGLTLFKLNLRNAANTVTNWFTTAATVARTWTLPDKDGTVAMTSDITGINSGTNTGDQDLSGKQATLVSGNNIKTVNGGVLLGAGDILVGDVTLAGIQTLTNKTVTEIVFALTGTTPAFTATNGAVQTWTLTAASSPTNALTTGQSIILVITPGAFAITWPSVVWTKQGGSGAAPTLFSAGKTSVVLWRVGTVLYGSHLGDTA